MHKSRNGRRPSGYPLFVSLATPFPNRFLLFLIHTWKYRLANDPFLPGFVMRPRRTLARSPRADPWEIALPWATLMVSQSTAAIPVRDVHGSGFACAKAVATSTSRDAGTNVTAKTPNACAWSGAGRRHGGRPTDARKPRLEPNTPRQNVRAVSVPPLRHKPRRIPRLRRRVVTQQKYFPQLLCATGPGAMNRP
jgi:hypothetical protein